jgi:hypothetical protein
MLLRLLLACLTVLVGCHAPPGTGLVAFDEGFAGASAASGAPETGSRRPEVVTRIAATPAAHDAATEAGSAAANRLMIRTAELAIEVPDLDAAIAACAEQLTAVDGYVAQRDGHRLVCRVPAASFESFVAELRTLGRVLHESMQVVDVTDQHRDLVIRLDNAKHARDRLLALLERAEEVEDLLRIEAELRRLTEEIERMTAQLKSLDDRIAMSTVTVILETPAKRGPVPVERRPSRFHWINGVGAEHVLRYF